MSIRSPLQLLMGLVCATLMFLSAGAGLDRVIAQSPCDSMSVTATVLDGCCFKFRFSKGSTTVNRVTISPSSGSVWSVEAGGVGGGTASGDSTQARFNFANGMPRTYDSAIVCFSTNSQQSFALTVRWYNGNTLLCTKTLTVKCGTPPPPPPGCFDLSQDSIRCDGKGGYVYSFRVINRSSFVGRSLTLRAVSPSSGITLSPSAINFDGIAPNGTSGVSTVMISGSQATAGRTITIIGQFCSAVTIRRDSISGKVDSSRTCCTDSITVTLPQCGGTNNKCFRLDSSSISCRDGGGYRWCFTFRNLSSRPYNSLTITSGTNGGSQTVSLVPAVQPNATGSLCINLTGGQAGQLVTNTLRFCYNIIHTDTVRRDSGWVLRDTVVGQECCSDTASIRLPQCGNTGGCMQFLEPRISCVNGVPILQMTVRNLSTFTARTLNFYVASPSGVTLTPAAVTLTPPLAPNGTASLGGGLQIGGNPPVGSQLRLIVMMCDSMKHCCTDTLLVTMPRCGDTISHDCCSNFRKAFVNLASSASSSGFASLTGSLSAGPSLIKSVSATLVSVSVNGQPAYGYFNFGLLYNAFGVGMATPPPYGSEEIWNASTGVSMTSPTQFLLSMKFPPLATNAKGDSVVYCIKFRYTDVNCVTCDTTICFTNVRRRFTGNGLGQKTEKNDGGLQGASGSPAVTGALTGATTGTMKIVFPQPPADLGPINYVGVRIATTDPSVSIVAASAAESGHTFSSVLGSVISSFQAAAGDEVNLQLTYTGLGARASLEHQVSLMYTLAKDPNSILVEDMVVTLSKSGTVVTDVVEPTHAGLTDAYTFAVHLTNKNSSNEPIAKMVITTSAPTKIVAVGPTASDTRATLQFGAIQDQSSNRNFVGEIVDGGQIAIAPTMEYGPIYLTLIGRDGESFGPTVHFITLNANDQVISEGDVTLSDPAAGVTHEEEGTGTSRATLRQSFPNPTTGAATIQFHLSREERNVTLVITDVKGSEVARLVDGESLTPGEHAAYFDTRNLPAGTYYYTLRIGDASETKSMQIVR